MTATRAQTRRVPIDEIKPHPRNPKAHALGTLVDSIRRFGFVEPIVVDQRTGLNVSGHGRVEALRRMRDAGEGPPAGITAAWEAPVYVGWASSDDREAEAALVALNRITEAGGWDEPALLDLLDRLADSDALEATGFADGELAELRARLAALEDDPADQARATLAERFGMAPVSVLDARRGPWRDRKRAWLALGIRSEMGRGGDLLGFSDTVHEAVGGHKPDAKIGGLVDGGDVGEGGWGNKIPDQQGPRSGSNSGLTIPSVSGADPEFYGKKRRAEKLLGREMDTAEFVARYYVAPAGPGNLITTGTSVFDPVLCELACRWFMPPGEGRVLDPFAGGSVRGIVAAWLGHAYTGVDLSEPQVEANRVQAAEILPDDRPAPAWHVGDATRLADAVGDDGGYDLVLSCPPYYDLERYSDHPSDLSNLASYDEFCDLHADAIRQAVDRLAKGRFAVWVVGEIRDPQGGYRGLVPDTIGAFRTAGCALYNEMILVTALGSLPVRVGRQMDAGRKVGKTHQNVLVFYKGDPRHAADGWGPPTGVELPETDPLDGDDLVVHEPA